MKTIGQIITAPIFNCKGVKNLQYRDEKSRFIVQGENFCKVYEKIKGIDFCVNDATGDVAITFDVNQIENYNKYGKFADFIKLIQCHNENKNEKNFWAKSIDSATKINNIQDILNLEKQIGYKTHIIHKNTNIEIGSSHLCTLNGNDIKFFKKSSKTEMHKKTNCGFIYDCNSNFLDNFNNCIRENENITKNIVITDVLPKIRNRQRFLFKNTHSLSLQTILSNSRVIVHYPTEQVLEKINYLIIQGVKKPKNLWIVLPHGSALFGNFNLITNVIFWAQNIIIRSELALTNIMYTNLVSPEKPKEYATNNIVIEKVLCKINKVEQYVLSAGNNQTYLHILDRLFFTNYLTKLPQHLYESVNCPICDNQFDESCVKSYLSCGHEFCPACVIELMNNKPACPICRKNIKCNNISIPNFTSNKVKYLTKMFNKIFNDDYDYEESNDNVLLYVDTHFMAKGLFMFITKSLCGQNCRLKCCIMSQKNNNYKSCIIICVKDKYFLSKNIKNIKHVIVLTGGNDYILHPESLGYDYCNADKKINIFLFDYCEKNNLHPAIF